MRLMSALLISTLAALPMGVARAEVYADQATGPLALAGKRFVDDWHRFRHRFVAADGRVIDSGNGDISHSEGQGYGMLFAVAAGDREAFDELRRWTRQVLQRKDGLHYWRYDPKQRPPITDPNSAADGELLIAWALLRAADRWQEAAYRTEALHIIAAFEDRLIRRIGSRLVIIPWDFADLDSPRVINLSYFVFPALQEIAVAKNTALWVELYEDCLGLVQTARFGPLDLPPDWLAIDDDNHVGIWQQRKPYFSYDAIRIPLYLLWAGHDTDAFLGRFRSAWAPFQSKRAPDWFDLTSQGGHSKDAAPVGFAAVRAVTESVAAAAGGGTANAADIANVYSARDYYSACLILLSRLAELEWWQAATLGSAAQPVTNELR